MQQSDPKSLVGLSLRAGLTQEEGARKVAEAAAHMKFGETDVLDALEGSRGEVAKLVCAISCLEPPNFKFYFQDSDLSSISLSGCSPVQ